MTAIDLGRMVKHRLKAAGMPGHCSPHSFRVTTASLGSGPGGGGRDIRIFATS